MLVPARTKFFYFYTLTLKSPVVTISTISTTSVFSKNAIFAILGINSCYCSDKIKQLFFIISTFCFLRNVNKSFVLLYKFLASRGLPSCHEGSVLNFLLDCPLSFKILHVCSTKLLPPSVDLLCTIKACSTRSSQATILSRRPPNEEKSFNLFHGKAEKKITGIFKI